MKHKNGIFLSAAILAALIVLFFYVRQSGGRATEYTQINPAIKSLGARDIRLTWANAKGTDSVQVAWFDPSDQKLGQKVTSNREILFAPPVSDEQTKVVLTPYSGGQSGQSTTMYLLTSCRMYRTALNLSDSIGTVDIILFALTQPPAGSLASNLCNWCPTAQPVDEYCDGAWFNTGYPSADQYYKVTARGVKADGSPHSVTFILRVTPAGAVQYVGSGTAAPCISLTPASLTQTYLHLVYDDGEMAFEMHGDEKAYVPAVRGVFMRFMRNVSQFSVEKIDPCATPQ